MFNFLTHFKLYAQTHLIAKKHCTYPSYVVIKSLITSLDFDIFGEKVENFVVFLTKGTKKEMKFSTSIENFKVNFYLVINLILRKRNLNLILWPKKTTICIHGVVFDIFSFFHFRQRMNSRFKKAEKHGLNFLQA